MPAAMEAQSSKKGKTKTAAPGIKGRVKGATTKPSTKVIKNDVVVVEDKENLANCFFGYEEDGDMNVPVEEEKTACESTTLNDPEPSSHRPSHVLHYFDPNFIAGKKSNVVENHPYNFAFEGGLRDVVIISKTKKTHLDPYYKPVAGKQNAVNEINPYNFAFGGDETVNLYASKPRKAHSIDPAQSPIAGQKATITEIYPFNFAFGGETERISYSSKSKKAPPLDPAQTPVAGLKAAVTEVFPYNFSWGSCEEVEETKSSTVMTTSASVATDVIYGKKATVTETHPYFFGWGGVDEHEKGAVMSNKDLSNR